MPVFQTPRLSAREMSPADLDFIAELLGDPEVMRFYPKAYTRVEAQGWIEGQMQRYVEHGHGLWLIQRRDTAEPVGQVGLLLQRLDGRDEAEVGYLIHRAFWRQGYATEAARATRDHAFGSRKYERVISLIRPGNHPSQYVARKLGMLPERSAMFRGLRHIVYSVTRGA